MEPLHVLMLELIEAGLRGSKDAVRRLGMRLLQEPASTSDEQFREQLTRVLLAEPTREPPKFMRAVGLSNRASKSESSATPWHLESGLAVPLTRTSAPASTVAPVLAEEPWDAIQQIISERTSPDALAQAGLEPVRTLLFTGAPGVGKTMAAAYVAGTLGLPLVTVDLASVMSSFLGRTGQNLRDALEQAKATECVLLLDEFDALGKRRDDPTDVGELKRIVNVLLQELEHWPTRSLLIAATNHPELLDRAIWRRFDRVIVFPLPDTQGRMKIVRSLLESHGADISDRALFQFVTLTEKASGSELTRLVREALRAQVIHGAGDLSDALQRLAIQRLARAGRMNEDARAMFAAAAHSVLGWSQRRIAEELGVSHVTVGKLLRAQSTSPRRNRPTLDIDSGE